MLFFRRLKSIFFFILQLVRSSSHQDDEEKKYFSQVEEKKEKHKNAIDTKTLQVYIIFIISNPRGDWIFINDVSFFFVSLHVY